LNLGHDQRQKDSAFGGLVRGVQCLGFPSWKLHYLIPYDPKEATESHATGLLSLADGRGKADLIKSSSTHTLHLGFKAYLSNPT
jgi:hypothetical protein